MKRARQVPPAQFGSGLFRFASAVRENTAVDAWFGTQPPALAAIARRWFVRMRHCGADVREIMHDGCPTACVGDAAFSYVAVFTAHVNVGFFFGAELPDPAAVLQGSGKRMRHVKVKPGAVLDVEALDALIEAAYRDVTRRLATQPGEVVARKARTSGRDGAGPMSKREVMPRRR